MMHADPLNTRDFTALESLEGALDWPALNAAVGFA